MPNRAILEAETRRKHAALNGDDIAEQYWAERVQILSDQAEAIRRRQCAPATFYAEPTNA